jgi:hypothetical protein
MPHRLRDILGTVASVLLGFGWVFGTIIGAFYWAAQGVRFVHVNLWGGALLLVAAHERRFRFARTREANAGFQFVSATRGRGPLLRSSRKCERPRWSFAGKIDSRSNVPSGRLDLSRVAARFNGFDVFQALT